MTARPVDRGASAVEYGLLTAAVAVVVIGAVTALGGPVRHIYACAMLSAADDPAIYTAGCGATIPTEPAADDTDPQEIP